MRESAQWRPCTSLWVSSEQEGSGFDSRVSLQWGVSLSTPVTHYTLGSISTRHWHQVWAGKQVSGVCACVCVPCDRLVTCKGPK